MKNLIRKALNKQMTIRFIGYQLSFSWGVSKYTDDHLDDYKGSDGLFINVGAGEFSHIDWINVDKIDRFYEEQQKSNTINYDLFDMEPMPFEDHSIDLIYTSHVIEHVSNESVDNFFKESYRILKVGGAIRIVCPDMELLINLYRRGEKSGFFKIRDYGREGQISFDEYVNLPVVQNPSIQQLLLWSFARQASIHHNASSAPLHDEDVDKLFATLSDENAMDYCADLCQISVQKNRPEEHINWWTESKLFEFLNRSGFKSVHKSRRNQSLFSEMRDPDLFDTNGPNKSLYMEAIK